MAFLITRVTRRWCKSQRYWTSWPHVNHNYSRYVSELKIFVTLKGTQAEPPASSRHFWEEAWCDCVYCCGLWQTVDWSAANKSCSLLLDTLFYIHLPSLFWHSWPSQKVNGVDLDSINHILPQITVNSICFWSAL